MIDFLYRTVLIGVGATALLDLWAWILQRLFKVPAPNWGLVGRWFCHLTEGKVFHDDITLAHAYAFERAVGWLSHYAVGIIYAGALLAFTRPDWTSAPTLAPALAVGLITVGAGWFLLQPGMGVGIAASKRPNATRIRVLNIAGHVIFGFGLYGSALLIR
ncbi:DUF2938 domain-containing protein [Microvirga sp. KLBC 81]|uniref:DUF2938 domain-containing protein n=1 Tax=Microvirga sp. KLBC 81 TaxID=1862707 RepID=UPI000D50B6EC|nr:DUF2938 domain-containing protein [Microvirga sp. KLBC 81]PVE20726.1 DUF2938 domain-containing protein [Microvirga sp. KLBC 81]